jgi:hypothetical protein
MNNHIITSFVSFLLLLLSGSCSTVDFIKAYSSLNTDRNFKDRIFNKRDITYKVGDLNQGWQLLDLEYGDLAFYNKSWNSTININSTCDSASNYNITILSDSLLSGLQNKKLIERSIVIVNNEDSLESKYLGEFEKNKVKMSIVVYKNEYCIYDFSYISDEVYFDKGYADYKKFVSDFELIENER